MESFGKEEKYLPQHMLIGALYFELKRDKSKITTKSVSLRPQCISRLIELTEKTEKMSYVITSNNWYNFYLDI